MVQEDKAKQDEATDGIRYEWLSLDSLRTDFYSKDDRGYQRGVKRRVNRIIKEFDPRKLGLITVSRRADGFYYIVDGNHRVTALRRLAKEGKAKSVVFCQIYDNLSYEDECELFYSQDDNKIKVSPVDKFHAKCEGNREDAIEINAVLDGLGLELSHSRCDRGFISCIGSIEECYQKYGEAVIKKALSILHTAWDSMDHCYDYRLVTGLCYLCNEYGDSLDESSMVKAMQRVGVSPVKILSDSSVYIGGNRKLKVCHALFDLYNHGKRMNRLEARDIF